MRARVEDRREAEPGGAEAGPDEPHASRRASARGTAAILLGAAAWGSTGTAAHFAPAGASPVSVGAARIVLGGAVLLAVAIGSVPVLTGLISRLNGGGALTLRWMLATAGAVGGCVVLVTGGRAAGVSLAGVGLALAAGRLISSGNGERAVMGALFGGGAVTLVPVLAATAAVLGLVVLGERLTGPSVVGLMLVGLALVTLTAGGRPPRGTG